MEDSRRFHYLAITLTPCRCVLCIAWQGELMPSIVLLAAGIPLGLNAFLILFLDLGTEIAPALSFAYESPDADAMERK